MNALIDLPSLSESARKRGKNFFKAFLMVCKSTAHSSQNFNIFSFSSCILGKGLQ